MKYISPVSAENARRRDRAQVAKGAFWRLMRIWWRALQTARTSRTKKYCFAITEEISRVGAGSGALKCSAPELKGDEYKRARAERTWDCVDLEMMRRCSEIGVCYTWMMDHEREDFAGTLLRWRQLARIYANAPDAFVQSYFWLCACIVS